MSNTVRIIAAVVDTRQLTLYRADGTSFTVAQGTPLIRRLVDRVIPALERDGYYELAESELHEDNAYAQAEESTNGYVRFFRLFKETMATLMEAMGRLEQEPSAPVAPCQAGSVPAPSQAQAVVDSILQQAATPTTPQFHEPLSQEETVVAVLEGGEVIPGMEKLSRQFQAVAAKLGSAEGVRNFLRRVASVPRAHSVEDLLTFMERGELPLADDGSVLVYKRLRTTLDEGVFVDCHTGKVRQRVGSYVCMDEALVDPDRRQECSNGLHVARRDYLQSFSGDVCVLAKLAPEDVIAVPHQDARKLRARAYHIIARLSDEDANKVCRNLPMADTELLGRAVAGQHVGVEEIVEIRGHGGTEVVVTALDAAAPQASETVAPAHSLDRIEELQQQEAQVDVKALAKQVAGNQRQLKAQALLQRMLASRQAVEQQALAQELVAFKKAAKVGWERLGISETEAASVLSIAGQAVAAPAAAPAPIPAEKPSEPAPQWAPSKMVNGINTGSGSPRERIRRLLDQGLTSKEAAQAIIQIKKQAKKAWALLGVSPAEEARIFELADQ